MTVFSATEYTKIYGPKKFSPKETYTENFIGAEKQTYKIIVTNGSGEEYVKKQCPENPLEKLICIASNQLTDLKINLDRVASAEITLNGKKIITPQNFNIKTRQIVLEVPVLKNNTLVISPKGIFTSYLTVEVQAPKETTLPLAELKIDPLVESQVTHITLTGSVSGDIDAVRAVNNIGGGFSNGTIGADGNFSVLNYMLSEGSNTVNIEALYKGAVVATKTILATLNTPAAGKKQMSPENGAIVEVTDASSDLLGAKMIVPAGGAARPFYVSIDNGAENMPNLPYGYVEVGPAVTFYPIWAEFLNEVTIVLPINQSLLPPGTSSEDVTIFAKSTQLDELENLIPSRRTPTSAEYKFKGRNFWTSLVAAVKIPLNPGELRVITNPPGANLNLDWIKKDVKSDTLLSGITPGEHQILAYLPGYNEQFTNFTMDNEGRELVFDLVRSGTNKPFIEIDQSIPDEVSESSNIFEISGRVKFLGDLLNSIVILSMNNQETTFTINPDGSFRVFIPLQSDLTKVHIRVTPNEADTGVSRTVHIKKVNVEPSIMRSFNIGIAQTSNEAQLENDMVSFQRRAEKLLKKEVFTPPLKNRTSLRTQSFSQVSSEVKIDGITDETISVALSWTSDDTDVDLHIIDPEGNHASYRDLEAIPGGKLDRDDTDGQGPELFTMDKARPGSYSVFAHYYSDHGNGPTIATINITVGGRTVYTGSMAMSDEENWNAYTILIDPAKIKIVEVQADGIKIEGSEAFFTTQTPFKIASETQDLIDDSRIIYQIKQKNFGIEKTLPGSMSGRQTSFDVSNHILSSAGSVFEKEVLWRRTGEPLEYEILACIDSCTEEGSIKSKAFTLKQNVKGQIIQEYLDKPIVRSTFNLMTPKPDQIIHREKYEIDFIQYLEHAPYDRVNKGHDFTSTGIIAVNFPHIIETIFNLPKDGTAGDDITPFINSTWRNPRNNDLIPASINSDHQEGNSVDFGIRYNAETSSVGGTRPQPESQYAWYIHILYMKACSQYGAAHLVLAADKDPRCQIGNDYIIDERNHVHISDN
jgi:uncharacterized protein YfaP (DUF2135 family)